MVTIEDQCLGSMLGLAIGDALGYPVEFYNRDEILKDFGVPEITDFVSNQFYKLGQFPG